jgi:hypothetical protein
MSVKYDKQIETIKAKGAQAFKDGLTIEDCPYKIESKQGRKFKRIWLAGYCEERDTPITVTEHKLLPGNNNSITIFELTRNGKPFSIEEYRKT